MSANPVGQSSAGHSAGHSPVGQPHARVDGRAKVTGSARYAADFNQPGQAYAVIVGAAIGLGRVLDIETGAASGQPGVLAVLTHLNAPKLAYAPHKGFIDPAHGERLHVLLGQFCKRLGRLCDFGVPPVGPGRAPRHRPYRFQGIPNLRE